MPTLAFMYMESIIAWSYEALLCGVSATDKVFKILFILQKPFCLQPAMRHALGQDLVGGGTKCNGNTLIPLYYCHNYPSFDLGDVYHCKSYSRIKYIILRPMLFKLSVPIFRGVFLVSESDDVNDDSRVICEILQAAQGID